MHTFLDFEKPIAELEGKIVELRKLAEADPKMDIDEEVVRLQSKVDGQVREIYAKLTPWQKTLVARHPARPHFLDYANYLFDEFTPLAGDRTFGEDKATIGGLARFRGRAVAIIGQEKGKDTKSRLAHNFGSAMPEGYRKARRIFEMADRFALPVISMSDTQGAFPGVAAEERGQAEAIARATQAGLNLTVPFITVILGEGMSGGTMGIAAANRVFMLQHSIYAVISPEGCASILWRSSDKAQEAAQAMRITAQDLLDLKVIDGIIPEPEGGAHRAPEEAMQAVGDQIAKSLAELSQMSPEKLKQDRREKYLAIGREFVN